VFAFLDLSRGEGPDSNEGSYLLHVVVEESGGRIVSTIQEVNLLDDRPSSAMLDQQIAFGFPDTLKRLQISYRRILSSYRLEVELPEETNKPRSWELKMADQSAARKNHIEVIYPHKLMPCTSPATSH
jgi:hypothetical protein